MNTSKKMELEFIIQKTEPYGENPEITIHRWSLSEGESYPIWRSVKGTEEKWKAYDKHGVLSSFAEEPSACLIVNDRLYMGTTAGHIYLIDLRDERLKARFGPRLWMKPYTIMGAFGIERIERHPSPATINRLVLFENDVIDASYAGLIKTEVGKIGHPEDIIDSRMCRDAYVVGKKLYILSYGMNSVNVNNLETISDTVNTIEEHIKKKEIGKIKARIKDRSSDESVESIVDVRGSRIIFSNIASGDYLDNQKPHLVGDSLYCLNGRQVEQYDLKHRVANEPCTINESFPITKALFAEHQCNVYLAISSLQESRLDEISFNKDGPNINLVYRFPSAIISSIHTAEKNGLFVSVYSPNNHQTRIMCPGRKPIVMKGNVKLLQAYNKI